MSPSFQADSLPSEPYPAKISSKTKREIKTFLEKQKLKASTPTDKLSENVKGSLSGFLSVFQEKKSNGNTTLSKGIKSNKNGTTKEVDFFLNYANHFPR